jgi:hypothetical protein
MRQPWKTLTIALAVLASGALGWAELVLDWRTPRSDVAQNHALGVNVGISLAPYNRAAQEAKQKYGDGAKVSFEFPPGRTRIESEGNIVHEETAVRRLNDVIGIFLIGQRGRADMAFPFRLAPDQDPQRIQRTLAVPIRDRFGKAMAQRLPSFTDQDWSIDRCVKLPDGLGLGGLGLLLRLRKGAACVVTWSRSQPAPTSMLISVSLADGDPWMRPFAPRLCRAITETALAQVDLAERDRPAYAACVLADRPARDGAQRALSSYVFAIGPGPQLARMD